MSDWPALAHHLAAALRSLPDDGFVTLLGPPRDSAQPHQPPADRPGLIGRLFGAGRTRNDAAPLLVQFRRTGTSLYAECSAGPRAGGRFPWTDEEHTALLAAGWQEPPPAGEVVYIRFFPAPGGPAPAGYLEGDLAEQAAELAVHTLRDVARERPERVELATG